ncbi:MAG: 2-oxo acid dehydrogenase subunit E2 [Candidatus Aenigmarchaeota archaeon]|nr:2-oxo acid dehydrogenase subunit E2 [Candidatus Aenigmarchaeota archaeon]
MPKEFKFPDIGEGIEEGEIVKWLIKEGDRVEEHQVVGEVETDKAVAEIPSPYSGAVLKINFKEGETVKVGQVLFVIGEVGEKYIPESRQEIKGPVMKAAGAVGYLEEAPDEEEVKPRPVIPPKAVGEKVLAAPAVRNLAKELGVDLTKVTGTGPEGRITEEDVKSAVGTKEVKEEKALVVKKKYDMWGYVDRIPLRGLRKVIATHMVESVKHIPHVTAMDEADVSKLFELREKEKVKSKEQGIHLTYMPFIMKACLAAMKEFPLLNSSLLEEEEEIVVKKYYNFGFAVDVDGEGLLVPVIKGVDIKNVFDIAKEVQELGEKAKQRKIDLQDLKGGTFTITNYGSLGATFATPIINYPEAAILGVGRMYDKPLAIAGKVEIRKVLPLSLVFDHRIVDGAYATRFMNSLIKHLQEPDISL